MANDVEKRIVTASFSLRAASKGKDDLSLEGYAAKFGVLSHPIGPEGFREVIAKGAFTRALAEKQDVIATIQHDPSKVLGRTKSGTLRLAQDDTGLAFRLALDPRQQSHRDLHAGVDRGDWDSCSWAFTVPDGGDDWLNGTRVLRDVNLHDIAIVQGPAYPQTEVSARALACYNTRRQTQKTSGPLPTVVTHPHLFAKNSIDAENRKRLLAIGTMICRDKTSNDIITDFELRQKAARIGAIIDKDEREEAFARLRAELGVEN
jgi:HK97 family phage prohead protease